MKKKSFDAVAFMRKRREEIDLEDAGLPWADKREKTRRILENDPLWQRLKDRVAQPRALRQVAAREQWEMDYGQSNS